MVAPEQARWRSTGTPSRRGHPSTERWQRLPATFVPGSKGGPARPYPQVLSQVSSCTRVRQGRRALASAGRSPVGNSGG